MVATSYAMVGICSGLAINAGSSPLTVVTIRTLGVVVLMLAYFAVAGVSVAMSRRDRSIALLLGFPLSLTTYLINAAIAHIPVPLAVLIFYLWPAITTGANWALGKEHFHWRQLSGLLLAFAGLATSLNVDFSTAQWKGVALAIGSALAWSATFILIGHFFSGRDTRPATFTMSLTAASVFTAVSAVTGAVVLPSSPAGWAGLASLPFFYAFSLIGLLVAGSRLGTSKCGFYMNFEPIASVLLAVPILGQRLAPVQLMGGALVITALFLFRPLRTESGPAHSTRR